IETKLKVLPDYARLAARLAPVLYLMAALKRKGWHRRRAARVAENQNAGLPRIEGTAACYCQSLEGEASSRRQPPRKRAPDGGVVVGVAKDKSAEAEPIPSGQVSGSG